MHVCRACACLVDATKCTLHSRAYVEFVHQYFIPHKLYHRPSAANVAKNTAI